jgi:hypothetical protein
VLDRLPTSATANRVLRVGAANTSPVYGQINLTTDVTGALPVANGGSGLNANPSMLVNLATATAANVLQASPRPGVTGILSRAHGGTNANDAFGLGGPARSVTGSWNNHTATGFYMGQNLTNAPPAITGTQPTHSWWYVLTINHNADWIMQFAVDFNGNSRTTRVCVGGTWSAWRGMSFTGHGHTANQINAGTFPEPIVAAVATSATRCIRNIIAGTAAPPQGNQGDIYLRII